jgi:hypothetical protein
MASIAMAAVLVKSGTRYTQRNRDAEKTKGHPQPGECRVGREKNKRSIATSKQQPTCGRRTG